MRVLMMLDSDLVRREEDDTSNHGTQAKVPPTHEIYSS